MNTIALQHMTKKAARKPLASWCVLGLSQRTYLDRSPKAETSGFTTSICPQNPEVGN